MSGTKVEDEVVRKLQEFAAGTVAPTPPPMTEEEIEGEALHRIRQALDSTDVLDALKNFIAELVEAQKLGVSAEISRQINSRESQRLESFWMGLFSNIISATKRFGRETDLFDVTYTVRGGREHIGRVQEVDRWKVWFHDVANASWLAEESGEESKEKDPERERLRKEIRVGSITPLALRSIKLTQLSLLRPQAEDLFQQTEKFLSRQSSLAGRFSPNSSAYQDMLWKIVEVDGLEKQETPIVLELEDLGLENVVLVAVNNYGLLFRDKYLIGVSDNPDPERHYFLPYDALVGVRFEDPARYYHVMKKAKELQQERAEKAKEALEKAKAEERRLLLDTDLL